MSQEAFFVINPPGHRLVQEKFSGTVRRMICDETTPTDNLVTGVVRIMEQGGRIPLHYHHVEEFQFIQGGQGLVRDRLGNEFPIAVGSCVYCRPGPEGAHEFENVGSEPLAIVFVFTSPGGKFPEIIVVESVN
jgi:mannose-6-phosphate isomerase-like protein (cupin superfamily)